MILSRDVWERYKNIIALADNLNFKNIPNPSYAFYRKHCDIVGKPYGWHLRPRIQNQVLMEGLLKESLFYFFQKNGEDIGYCFIEAPTTNNEVEISDFGFKPDLTGQGFGKTFFPHMLERVFNINEGIANIILSTRSTNHKDVPSFYELFGFKIAFIEDKSEEILESDGCF